MLISKRDKGQRGEKLVHHQKIITKLFEGILCTHGSTSTTVGDLRAFRMYDVDMAHTSIQGIWLKVLIYVI